MLQFELRKLGLKQRRISRIDTHLPLRADMERRPLELRQGFDCLRRATDVPHPHAIKRLAQKHVTAADVIRLFRVT